MYYLTALYLVGAAFSWGVIAQVDSRGNKDPIPLASSVTMALFWPLVLLAAAGMAVAERLNLR